MKEGCGDFCGGAFRVQGEGSFGDSTRVEIVFVDPILWSKGWTLYEQRPDKAWSLTDCISFEVMREQKIHDALTSDRHFVQAGFRALLMKVE